MWVKIADFGVSQCTKNTFLRTQVVSPGYTSPELLGLVPRNGVANMTYSNGVDIWALGCIIHEMLTGEIPFLGSIQELGSEFSLETVSNDGLMPQTDITALHAFCNGTIGLPTDSMQKSGVSIAAVECVKSMLVAIPNSRVTAQDALQCEWLRPPADFGVVPEMNQEQSRRNHM